MTSTYILISTVYGMIFVVIKLLDMWDVWKWRNWTPAPHDLKNLAAWSIPVDQYWPN